MDAERLGGQRNQRAVPGRHAALLDDLERLPRRLLGRVDQRVGKGARRNPSVRSVVKLANALRVPVAMLVTPLGPNA